MRSAQYFQGNQGLYMGQSTNMRQPHTVNPIIRGPERLKTANDFLPPTISHPSGGTTGLIHCIWDRDDQIRK